VGATGGERDHQARGKRKADESGAWPGGSDHGGR